MKFYPQFPYLLFKIIFFSENFAHIIFLQNQDSRISITVTGMIKQSSKVPYYCDKQKSTNISRRIPNWDRVRSKKQGGGEVRKMEIRI